MGDYTATSSMTLEAAITAGSMVSGENLTVSGDGITVTCDRTPSILLGMVRVENGKLLIDGANIGAGNMINFVGEYIEELDVRYRGELEVDGDWYSIGSTDGSNSQVFNLATYYDSSFCVDIVPMIQVETGRRIDFDGEAGTTPSVNDWVYKTSDRTCMGRIIQVEATYLIVRFLTGALINNDPIQVRAIVDNDGPDLQVSWTALVNNASGDIQESGVYQEFGNSRGNGSSHIAAFGNHVSGFVFDNAFQSTSLTMGSAVGGGFVPPTGCDVRVPNVHFSTATTTTYASNNTYHDGSATEDNWWQLYTVLAGKVAMSICNWGSTYAGSQNASQWDLEYVGASIECGCSQPGCRPTYSHCVVVPDGMNRGYSSRNPFRCVDLTLGAAITDCMVVAGEAQQTRLGAQESVDVDITGCIHTCACNASWDGETYALYALNAERITFTNTVVVSGDHAAVTKLISLSASSDITFDFIILSMTQDYTDATATESNVWSILNHCSGVLIRGIEFIDGGGVPGDDMVLINDSSDVKVRCCGLITEKVDFGTDAEWGVYAAGICDGIDVARIWIDNGVAYNGALFMPTTGVRTRLSNCSGDYLSVVTLAGRDDLLVRGLHGGSGTPGNSAGGIEDYIPGGYGRQIHDGFRSDTVGWICFAAIPPTTAVNNVTYTTGTPTFNNDGDMWMSNGDVIEFTMDYFALGHTSFPGTYTSAVGSSAWNADEWTNITLDFQYQLLGGAWNGSWLDVRTAGNWTGITGAIEEGIKFKFRFTATGDQANMSLLIIDSATTLADQQANLVPIDQDYVTVRVTTKKSSDLAVQSGARVYLKAASGGDLTEGTIILSDLSDVSGVVEDTEFLYTNDQPVIGWTRKMTTTPKYKQGVLGGTITSTGFIFDSYLVNDE